MAIKKRGKYWNVDITFNGKRYRKKSPKNTREGALAYEAHIRSYFANGKDPFKSKNEIENKETFAEFSDRWLEVYVKNNNKHSEIISKESILRFNLIPFFGKTSLDKIDTQMIEQYKQEKIKTKICNKTINNHLAVIKKCLKTAWEWKVLKDIPEIKLLKTSPQEYTYLSESECKTLLDNTSGNLHDMILIGLNTGLRFGEIIALTWQDINLEKKLLSVNKSIAKGKLGSTKSNRNRYIPINEQLYEMLKSRKIKKGLLFCENGMPLKQKRYCYLLYKACRQLNLHKISWHVLRHTFASHLAEKDVSMKVIQKLLGHSDIRTTMRYAHLSPQKLQSATDVLNLSHYTVTTPNFSLEIGKK